MSIVSSIKRLLYRTLPLGGYLRVLSCAFFAGFRLGLGKRSAAYEYPRFLRRLVRKGDCAIDIGANLGYYSRIMARLVGEGGKIYAVEPVKPILEVLRHNLRRCGNVSIVPYALGSENKPILMANDSARNAGYMGTGRNCVREEGDGGDDELYGDECGMTFEVEMRRGSELFAGLDRLDFIKCDVEGYENVIIPEMTPVIERHLPVVLLETGGANRRPMIERFRGWGYAGYTLHEGRLVSVVRPPKSAKSAKITEKDIVFIPGHRHGEFAKMIRG